MTTKEDVRCRKCSGMTLSRDGTMMCAMAGKTPVPVRDIGENECPLDDEN